MGAIESRWSASRPDRAELEPCCICDVDDGECRDGFVHAGRRWEIGITWPGSTFALDRSVLDGVCRATVEDRYEPEGDDDYDVALPGCVPRLRLGVRRSTTTTPTTALEDALDHVLPEWRRVPGRRIASPTTRRRKQRDRWLDQLAELYAGARPRGALRAGRWRADPHDAPADGHPVALERRLLRRVRRCRRR